MIKVPLSQASIININFKNGAATPRLQRHRSPLPPAQEERGRSPARKGSLADALGQPSHRVVIRHPPSRCSVSARHIPDNAQAGVPYAGERAVQTYQRHQVADAIFSQSETFDDSDMQAPEDAVDVVVRAIPDSGYEPENDENEQGHTLQDSDLSWLVSDIPNYHLRLTHTRFALHSAHAPFWVHQ